jgi:hypothetical protein
MANRNPTTGRLPAFVSLRNASSTSSAKGKKTMQQNVAIFTNGVDVTRMQETIDAVKASPELGSFEFRIQNRWVNGGENLSEVKPFSAGGKLVRHKSQLVLAADEPDVLLGTDTGANPVEHLLHALAACVTTSMV